MASTVLEAEKDAGWYPPSSEGCRLVPSSVFPFDLAQDPTPWTAAAHNADGSFHSTTLMEIIPHRCAGRFVSMVTLNPIELTIRINRQGHSVSSTGVQQIMGT